MNLPVVPVRRKRCNALLPISDDIAGRDLRKNAVTILESFRYGREARVQAVGRPAR
jgi:hypothetical protein